MTLYLIKHMQEVKNRKKRKKREAITYREIDVSR